MARTSCAHGDRIRSHSDSSIVLGTENLHCGVGTSPSYSLLNTTPHLDIARTYDYFRLSHPSSATHQDILSSPRQLTHPLYGLSPTGSGVADDTPIACRSLGFSHPSELYSPWTFRPSPDLFPSSTCEVSLSTHHRSALDPAMHPSSPRQSSWSAGGDIQVSSVATPINLDLLAFPLPIPGPPPHPNLDNVSEPQNTTLDASYPCQWTQGGISCNVMVQATRSHINRHLHICHGFGGSDTQQTRCNWAGCGAMMQQGSIARHMVTCHLQAKVTCPMCFKKLSRQDVISKHQRVCPAAGTWR